MLASQAPTRPPTLCSGAVMLPECDQPGSPGENENRLASRYSSSGAIRISAMSRHRRWRRGFGALAASFAAPARCRLLRSVIARATVWSDLKKTLQLDDSTHNCPTATTVAFCREPGRHPRPPAGGRGGDGYSVIPSSAGCTSLPPSTLMPRTSAWLPRQSPPAASLFTQGRIAAQIACELVCGTAPGMLVTQKWVTPSST